MIFIVRVFFIQTAIIIMPYPSQYVPAAETNSASYPPWNRKWVLNKKAAVLCGWEGNRKSGVGLWYIQWPQEDECPAYTPVRSLAPFICIKRGAHSVLLNRRTTTVWQPMWLRWDGDNARWCRRDQQVSEQPDEVEMTEVVRLECCLEAIISQRVSHAEHTSVENENVQRTI